MTQTAQKVYADALFQAALELDQLEEIHTQLAALSQVIAHTPEFLVLLASPAMTPSDKEKVLRQTLEGQIAPALYNFMRILSDKARTPLLPQIVSEFEVLYRQHHGILLVTAVSAVPFTPDQQQKLTQKLESLTGKKILMDNQVDPSVLGGVILRYEGKEIDGSVRERLAGLRRSLMGVIA